mgnify:CR=1 FL=1
MDWMNQDWEHEALKDEIYLMEHRRQMEIEWQQWEEEQERKKRLPAIIQISIDETKRKPTAVRGAHQEGL